LGMTETMRRENHKALVHTAAASNLGQMLNKVCIKDGIGLVNIVRSAEQAKLLKGIGAKHVVDSTAPTFQEDLTQALVHTAAASNLGQMLNRICNEDGIGLVNIVRNAAQAKILKDIGAKHIVDSSAASFQDDLVQALVETGATIAFDAIGGGKLASQILTAMEIALNKTAKEYSRYGSTTHKQVYVYGSLNTGAVELTRNYGMAWGVGGWLLTPFLQKIGRQGQGPLRERVVNSLKTTFASHYTKTISLPEALDLANIAVYNKRATGEKYLINPNKS
ncbi:MAG TPA: hypothetical protein VK634_01045, partial [Reyranella sp.]|nr:hypothetical protein [Reyranella sp.]